jgi:hypothetical protein
VVFDCSAQRERRFRCARSRARTEHVSYGCVFLYSVFFYPLRIPVFRVSTPSVFPYSVFRTPPYSRIPCFAPLRIPVFRVSHLPPEIRVGGRHGCGVGHAPTPTRC